MVHQVHTLYPIARKSYCSQQTSFWLLFPRPPSCCLHLLDIFFTFQIGHYGNKKKSSAFWNVILHFRLTIPKAKEGVRSNSPSCWGSCNSPSKPVDSKLPYPKVHSPRDKIREPQTKLILLFAKLPILVLDFPKVYFFDPNLLRCVCLFFIFIFSENKKYC